MPRDRSNEYKYRYRSKKDRGNRWSAAELLTLMGHYPKGGAELVKAKGVDRPLSSIRHRASYMRIEGPKLKSSRLGRG